MASNKSHEQKCYCIVHRGYEINIMLEVKLINAAEEAGDLNICEWSIRASMLFLGDLYTIVHHSCSQRPFLAVRLHYGIIPPYSKLYS